MFIRLLSILLLAYVLQGSAFSQESIPPGQGDHFTDTSSLKLLPGEDLAVVVFEDPECPTCARAYPYVHAAVFDSAVHLHRYDFPLPQHPWALAACMMARYLQDQVGERQAEEFRKSLFLAQKKISGKSDLYYFSQKWFEEQKIDFPQRLDPSGTLASEINADIALGQRVGLSHTPTVIVLTPTSWIQVVDVSQLGSLLDRLKLQNRKK